MLFLNCIQYQLLIETIKTTNKNKVIVDLVNTLILNYLLFFGVHQQCFVNNKMNRFFFNTLAALRCLLLKKFTRCSASWFDCITRSCIKSLVDILFHSLVSDFRENLPATVTLGFYSYYLAIVSQPSSQIFVWFSPEFKSFQIF